MRLANFSLVFGLLIPSLALAEQIGEVDTVFKWLGPNWSMV